MSDTPEAEPEYDPDQVSDRVAVQISRTFEIQKGRSYRFRFVAHQAKPHITEDNPRDRTIVPVISFDATLTGTVQDILDGETLFIITQAGAIEATSEAIEWAEEVA